MIRKKQPKGPSPYGPMGDFLDTFCQQKGTRPIFDCKEAKGASWNGTRGWQCTLRVHGVPETATALGATKMEAQTAACREFVVRLQASGVRVEGAGQDIMGSKASWALGAAAGGGGVSGLNLVEQHAKRIKTEGPLAAGRKNITGEMGTLCQLLRAGRTEEALQYAEVKMSDCPRCMTVKNLAAAMTSLAVRTREPEVLAFLDGIAALDLIDFPNSPAAAYFWRFGRWAIREFLAEGKAALQGAATMIPQQLERQGTCIPLLNVTTGKSITELQLSPLGGDLPKGHSFQMGDWIFLTTPNTDNVVEWAPHPGHANGTFEAELTTFLPAPQVGICVKVVGAQSMTIQKMIGGTCRVDKAANHVTFRRQMNALYALCVQPGELDWLSCALLAAEEEGGHEKVAQYCNTFPPGGGFPSASPILRQANPSQYAALQAATTRRLTLIQGPPGAGKTSTAVMLMRLWISCGRKPILATADSNIAADNLVEGCANSGMNVVRVGRKEGMRSDLQDFNLYEKARTAGQLSGPRHNWKGEKKILEEADVVCCTCSGSDHPAMQHIKFRNILVDEAGQTTELSTLVPMMHLQADGSAVLVGDHKQLPATVSCLQADVEGLGTSLFQRLTTLGVPGTMLDVQYRMHPAIACFPSRQYYGGRLRTGCAGHARRAPVGIMWPNPQCPLAFLPLTSEESKEGKSFVNVTEVQTIVELLQAVLSEGDVQPGQVGIITPYAAQARLLRTYLGLNDRPKGVPGPEVSSVDGFQGREKELIFISTVRANTAGRVGFMGDPRRLNVMLTRARRGLVVVGDFATLSADTDGWRPWLVWCQERGLIVGCAGTNPEAGQELAKLDGLEEHELIKATSTAQNEEAAREAMEAYTAGQQHLVGSNGGQDMPRLRQKKKSLLMQLREEEEAKAKAEAEAAAKNGGDTNGGKDAAPPEEGAASAA